MEQPGVVSQGGDADRGPAHLSREARGEASFWDARHKPNTCRLSHAAQYEPATAGRWEDVTEVVRVESVDVISAGSANTT